MDSLAARLARGDESAFVELYDACADPLHRYVAGRLGLRDVAADVVQSTFLKAVKSRRRFRGVVNPVAYMYKIARNEAARAAKRRKRVHAVPIHELDSATEEAGEQLADAEIAAAAIKRLDSADREVVELKIFAGLTLREISDVTGMPPGTVATRYRRALESLRGWLTKQFR